MQLPECRLNFLVHNIPAAKFSIARLLLQRPKGSREICNRETLGATCYVVLEPRKRMLPSSANFISRKGSGCVSVLSSSTFLITPTLALPTTYWGIFSPAFGPTPCSATRRKLWQAAWAPAAPTAASTPSTKSAAPAPSSSPSSFNSDEWEEPE